MGSLWMRQYNDVVLLLGSVEGDGHMVIADAQKPLAPTETGDLSHLILREIEDILNEPGLLLLHLHIYTLLASADGYVTTAPMTTTITGGSTSNLVMTIQVDSRTYNGTVSGVVTDKNSNAVAGCFVGLYQVISDGTTTREVLLASTKTNSTGSYLFGGVTGGQYLVKAKVSQ